MGNLVFRNTGTEKWNLEIYQSLSDCDKEGDYLVRNSGDMDIQVSNIKEGRDFNRNQIEGILKTLIATMANLRNGIIANIHETLEIQNL